MIAETYGRDGFAVVRGVLRGELLASVREECDGAAAKQSAAPNVVEHVIDLLEDEQFDSSAPCRVDAEAYFAMRRRCSVVQGQHQAAMIRRLLECVLPQLVARATGWHPNCIKLFNEHFIVKAPGSGVMFRWHRDADKQLAMCLKPDRCDYVSVWCPLDATTVDNGTLILLPQSRHAHVHHVDELRGPQLSSEAPEDRVARKDVEDGSGRKDVGDSSGRKEVGDSVVCKAVEKGGEEVGGVTHRTVEGKEGGSVSVQVGEEGGISVQVGEEGGISAEVAEEGGASAEVAEEGGASVQAGEESGASAKEEEESGASAKEEEEEGKGSIVEAVCVDAGDAVVFSSRLWHCSPPNQTSQTRRVLYAQYSRGVVTSTASSATPLRMAVACRPCSHDEGRDRRRGVKRKRG